MSFFPYLEHANFAALADNKNEVKNEDAVIAGGNCGIRVRHRRVDQK
jgi:hypothetical protein